MPHMKLSCLHNPSEKHSKHVFYIFTAKKSKKRYLDIPATFRYLFMS